MYGEVIPSLPMNRGAFNVLMISVDGANTSKPCCFVHQIYLRGGYLRSADERGRVQRSHQHDQQAGGFFRRLSGGDLVHRNGGRVGCYRHLLPAGVVMLYVDFFFFSLQLTSEVWPWSQTRHICVVPL